MKILLIYPYCLEDRLHEEEVSFVPIGLYYVGAFLKENHYADLGTPFSFPVSRLRLDKLVAILLCYSFSSLYGQIYP